MSAVWLNHLTYPMFPVLTDLDLSGCEDHMYCQQEVEQDQTLWKLLPTCIPLPTHLDVEDKHFILVETKVLCDGKTVKGRFGKQVRERAIRKDLAGGPQWGLGFYCSVSANTLMDILFHLADFKSEKRNIWYRVTELLPNLKSNPI
jgi:hypothetical protein